MTSKVDLCSCFLLPLQVGSFADSLVVYRNQFMREVASTSEV